MKNLRGIIVAAIFLALTLLMRSIAVHFDVLMNMVYPFAAKSLAEILGTVTAPLDFCLWQVILAVFAVAVVVSLGLCILFRWNLLRWLGWVLAPVAVFNFLFTSLWGLNFYDQPLQKSMKLELSEYTPEELRDAALYFRGEADKLAAEMPRDAEGNFEAPELSVLNPILEKGYDALTMEHSVFSGSRGPVKPLGFPWLFDVEGISMPITGEAAVHPDLYGAKLPFAMGREVAHLLSIARDDEAAFASYLACIHTGDPMFLYSGNLEAFRLCAQALEGHAEAKDLYKGASDGLLWDLAKLEESPIQPKEYDGEAVYTEFLDTELLNTDLDEFSSMDSTDPTEEPAETEAPDLTVPQGTPAADLLVSWYLDTQVIDDTPEVPLFDPYDYDKVFPTEPVETEPTEGEG